MITLSFLVSGLSLLFGILGITTIYPALINIIFDFFS